MMEIRIVKGAVADGKPAKPRFRTARIDGRALRVRVVDPDSPSFGADFGAAFAANVRRARRENDRVEAAE